jgi:hypothetical protein
MSNVAQYSLPVIYPTEQFANLASGRDDLTIGHSTRSCTQNVDQTVPFKVDGRPVVLIDCPGFDDSHSSDAEILKRIAAFLTFTYEMIQSKLKYMYSRLIQGMRRTSILLVSYTFTE